FELTLRAGDERNNHRATNGKARHGRNVSVKNNSCSLARLFGLDFLRALAIAAVVMARGFGFLMPHLPWWCGFLDRSTISMPGMVAAGWALLYRCYESRCTHLRERVAPAVARLLRRNCGLPIAGKNCRALRSSPP